MAAFDHRRLRVYNTALELNVVLFRVAGLAPRRCLMVTDQALRAATSLVLNIAEGAGEFSRGDKARFYRIARRSAAETAAALDLLRAFDGITETEFDHAMALAESVGAMLTVMIKRLGTGAGTGGSRRSTPGAGTGGSRCSTPGAGPVPPHKPQPQPQPQPEAECPH